MVPTLGEGSYGQQMSGGFSYHFEINLLIFWVIYTFIVDIKHYDFLN